MLCQFPVFDYYVVRNLQHLCVHTIPPLEKTNATQRHKDPMMGEGGKGDSSPTAAVMAYYALLQQNDVQASRAVWVNPDPDHPAWEAVGNKRSYYRVNEVNDYFNNGSTATTRVHVSGRNENESTQHWLLDFHWVNTQVGWLVTQQTRIG